MSLASQTRALLIANVRRALQEKTAGKYSATDLERWVDLACLDLCAKTRCLQVQATAATVAGQQRYTIPANGLGAWAVTRLDLDGARLELHPWDSLHELIPPGLSLSSQGTPVYWCPFGRTINLWPVPSGSGGTLRMHYAKMPESMSADTVSLADLGIPEYLGPAVEAYMLYLGRSMDGDTQGAMAALQIYQRYVDIYEGRSLGDGTDMQKRGNA